MTDKNHLTIPGALEWCEPPARRDFDYDRGFCAGSAEVETIRLERDASLAREAALREELDKSKKLLSQARSMVNGATDEWHAEAQKIIKGK